LLINRIYEDDGCNGKLLLENGLIDELAFSTMIIWIAKTIKSLSFAVQPEGQLNGSPHNENAFLNLMVTP